MVERGEAWVTTIFGALDMGPPTVRPTVHLQWLLCNTDTFQQIWQNMSFISKFFKWILQIVISVCHICLSSGLEESVREADNTWHTLARVNGSYSKNVNGAHKINKGILKGYFEKKKKLNQGTGPIQRNQKSFKIKEHWQWWPTSLWCGRDGLHVGRLQDWAGRRLRHDELLGAWDHLAQISSLIVCRWSPNIHKSKPLMGHVIKHKLAFPLHCTDPIKHGLAFLPGYRVQWKKKKNSTLGIALIYLFSVCM